MQKDQHAISLFLRRAFACLAALLCAAGSLGGVFWYPQIAHAQLAQSVQSLQQTAGAAGLGGGADLPQLIGRIINIFLGTLGIIFLGLMLYAGYLWMTAGGDEKKIEQAKGYIKNAIIGLVIIASAFAITAYILNSLAGVTGFGGIQGGPSGGVGGLVGSSGSLGNGIIEYHLPERNATNVPRNTPIIITFKQPIQPASFIDGWTEANSSLTTGLNAGNVKIFPSGNAAAALTSVDARVNFTQDRRTFVVRPLKPIGSPSSNVKYTIQLKGGNSGILLETGSAAFSGSFNQGYEWGFEVSTVLDLTPPRILSVIPTAGGKYARNSVVQITFNEAVDPTSASGKFTDKVGFTNMSLRNGGSGDPLQGEYKITNQYRTVEFLTFEKCGVNSCGKDVFCLPPNATLEGTVEAATLSSQPPQAQLSNQGFDGITDVVGNSLDGNADGLAQGKPKDSYVWSFATNDQVKLTPPKIIETVPSAVPGSGQSNRALDESVTATFDDVMQASTFTSEAAYIEPKGPGETNPDTFWWTVGMNLLTEKGLPIKAGETAVRAQLVMKHRPYIPSGIQPSELNFYNPFLLSDLQDAYQNCFNPASFVSANNPAESCAGLPNCCNAASKSQACTFSP